MSDGGENTPSGPPTPPASDRLDSWKEIAAYLRRGVSTVQRWEKEEGLPTHRLHHPKQGSVYAFKSELDAWVRDRRERIEVEDGVAKSDVALDPDAREPRSIPLTDPSESPAVMAHVEPPAPAPTRAAAAAPAPAEPNRLRTLALWLGGSGVVLAIVLATRVPIAPPTPVPALTPGPPRAFPITSSRGLERHPALSPDGRWLAYVSNDGAESFDLYVKEVLDSSAPTRLTNSASSECCPAWSPDGRSLAFLQLEENQAALMTIPARGGPAARRGINVTPWFGSALSYSPDGRFLAFSDRATDGGPFLVKLLELATGEVRLLTQPSPDFSGDAFPRFSPDGRHVALARLSASADVASADIYDIPVEGGEPVRLTRDQRFLGDLDWSRDGREILFVSDRSLTNVRLWRTAVSGGEPRLVWPGGDPSPAITFAESFMDVSHTFRFSVAREADRIAVTKRVYDTNIFRIDPHDPAPAPRPFIGSSEVDESPQVSPDGQRIAFTSMRSGHQEIWLCTSEGTGCSSIARTPNGGTPRWAPDSRSLVYDEWSPHYRHADVFTIDVRSLAVRRITSLDDADDLVPSFSRDGKSIYFASNRTGSWQVFRTSATGGSAVQLTREGGFAAFEAPSGDPVFYTRFNAPGLFEVPRAGGKETQRLDRPRCWGHWAMAPDGIYLLDSREGQKTRLEFEGFGGGPPREIATLAQQPPCAESSLAASPDGSFLLWVGIEEGSDIFRVDDLK